MRVATILVADDSATVRTQVKRVLSDAGFEVIQAADGQAALELIRQQAPDLAIIDISMPALDGYGVCQEMKRMGTPWSEVPIILLTSCASHALELLGEQWGAYVAKPVSVTRLLEVVESLLKEGNRARGSQSAVPT
jgi:DNA-binding response OmpR family regulator